jgi:hypothetical protein
MVRNKQLNFGGVEDRWRNADHALVVAEASLRAVGEGQDADDLTDKELEDSIPLHETLLGAQDEWISAASALAEFGRNEIAAGRSGPKLRRKSAIRQWDEHWQKRIGNMRSVRMMIELGLTWTRGELRRRGGEPASDTIKTD